jgi:outer membrane protein TolC
VPIDDLSLQQQYLQAKVALKQNEITLAETKRQVVNDVTNAFFVLQNQKQQITQAKLAVQLAQQTLDIANAKLKYGKVSPFEASTLQTNLLTAQLNYISTVAAYETNLAALDQILGNTLNRWHVRLSY